MSETIIEDFANAIKRVIEGLGGLASMWIDIKAEIISLIHIHSLDKVLLYLSPTLSTLILLTVPPLALFAVYFGMSVLWVLSVE